MNKESGMLGLCGFSDNRDVENAYLAGDEDAKVATDVYIHTLLRFIGGYIAVLGGVDAIAFTAGVGENSAIIRKMVCERLSYLGIQINDEANNKRGKTIEISTPSSKVKVFVVPTNEELVIAQDTVTSSNGHLRQILRDLPSSRTSMYAPVSAPLKSYNMPHYLRFMSEWAS